MVMGRFSKLSDEELAVYLDGILSGECTLQESGTMDVDTFELLNVSRKALNEPSVAEVIQLPSWDTASEIVRPMYEPLAMAGFLGERNVDEIGEEETDEEE